jgi:hypothetical protein
MKIYHGSDALFDTISLSASRNYRDFGKGFYTTYMKEQAVGWANHMCRRHVTKTAYLYEYEYEDLSGLDVKQFSGYNKEWLEFVGLNRIQGGIQHNFYIVIGPVANDDTMETLRLYFRGLIDEEYTLHQLTFRKSNNQISFHTPKALQTIKQIGRTEWTV